MARKKSKPEQSINNNTAKKRKPNHVRNIFSNSSNVKPKSNAFQQLWTGNWYNDRNVGCEENDLLSDVCSIFDKRYSPRKKCAIKNWVASGNYTKAKTGSTSDQCHRQQREPDDGDDRNENAYAAVDDQTYNNQDYNEQQPDDGDDRNENAYAAVDDQTYNNQDYNEQQPGDGDDRNENAYAAVDDQTHNNLDYNKQQPDDGDDRNENVYAAADDRFYDNQDYNQQLSPVLFPDNDIHGEMPSTEVGNEEVDESENAPGIDKEGRKRRRKRTNIPIEQSNEEQSRKKRKKNENEDKPNQECDFAITREYNPVDIIQVGNDLEDEDENTEEKDEGERKARRKRRKTVKEKKEEEELRKAGKRAKEVSKHIFLSPCKCKQKKCGANMTEEERKAIHKIYWEQDYSERRRWIASHVEEIRIKKRYVEVQKNTTETDHEDEENVSACNSDENKEFKRQKTLVYKLPKSDGKQLSVCKIMFLRTLGFKDGNDKPLVTAIKSSVLGFDSGDKRGRHAPKHKLSPEELQFIQDHIRSYNPCISHYRREHAPNRYYLPPELTVVEMHADYEDECKKNEIRSVTYQRYTKEISEMNISFAKTGDERCEVCEEHNMHMKDIEKVTGEKEKEDGEFNEKLKKNLKKKKKDIQERNAWKDKFCSDDDCERCVAYQDHRNKKIVTRQAYESDKQAVKKSKGSKMKNTLYASCDMQKVILLPRLPGYKVCLFTKRLVTINQTFAPLLDNSIGKPVGILWHEAIMGRNDEDVASAYIKFMKSGYARDYKEFIIWADNCSGQNKNWTLFTALTWFVNLKAGPNKITIKYFVKGHTYMSADSFHRAVEGELKNEEKVCDWEDFTACVSAHGKAIDMKIEDFRDFPNALSHGKASKEEKPLLEKVYVSEFRKGSTKWYYKLGHTAEFQEHDFLQNQRPKKFKDSFKAGTHTFERKNIRGINAVKRKHIIDKLGDLMGAKRTEFFVNMQGNAELDDLCDTR